MSAAWRRTTWPWRLRIALRDRDTIAALRQLRSIDPTHGDCPACGKHLASSVAADLHPPPPVRRHQHLDHLGHTTHGRATKGR